MTIELIFQEERTWSEIEPGTYDGPEPTKGVIIPHDGILPEYSGVVPSGDRFDYTAGEKYFGHPDLVEIRAANVKIPCIDISTKFEYERSQSFLWIDERKEWVYLGVKRWCDYETRRSGWRFGFIGPHSLSKGQCEWLVSYFDISSFDLKLEDVKSTSIDEFRRLKEK